MERRTIFQRSRHSRHGRSIGRKTTPGLSSLICRREHILLPAYINRGYSTELRNFSCGYGATLKTAFTNSSGAALPYGAFLGGLGQIQDGNHSARVASVAAGSNYVTLIDPSKTSLFKVGNYALMAGVDMMAYGFPSNPYYFQYVKVIAINPTTGVIAFDAPLTDSYKSTRPNYVSGSASSPDQGGPATFYAFDPSWDMEVEYRGLTFSMPGAGQLYAVGRSVTFTDTTFPDACPSRRKTARGPTTTSRSRQVLPVRP